jgi:hypothetical protein
MIAGARSPGGPLAGTGTRRSVAQCGIASLIVFLLFCARVPLSGEDLLDRDPDSLFDTPTPMPPAMATATTGETPEEIPASPISLHRRGFTLDFSYNANAGFSPGLSEVPWFNPDYESVYSHVFGINLNSALGFDVQISPVLRAKSSLALSLPGNGVPTWRELFLDYSIAGSVFFRFGKFGLNWGISRVFPSANLLSRIPKDNKGGDPYLFKADIPIGIGGLQFVALTRPGFMAGTTPGLRETGYGVKYNLAFTWADIDVGTFFHAAMPLRGFAAAKTTIGNTELYLESMAAIRHEYWDGLSVSGNLGVVQTLLNGALTVQGEIFWNGEEDAVWFKPETDIEEEAASPFIPGLNAAFNLAVKPGWPWGARLFLRGLWAWKNNTCHITPGLSASPLEHMTISLAFPLALGSREGHYYTNNADTQNRPFSAVFLITLGGSYRFAHDE